MLKILRCKQVEVFISHPFGDVWIDLDDWCIQGPLRKFTRPSRARCSKSHIWVPLWIVVPFRYRNDM